MTYNKSNVQKGFKKLETFSDKIFGLMEYNEPLLIENKKEKRTCFHSILCPKFLAILENSNGFINADIIKPYQLIRPKKPFLRLYEIPLDEETERGLQKEWHKQKKILEMQNSQLVKKALE